MPYSEPFTKMAARIDHNADTFGGAVVIVPPLNSGEFDRVSGA